MPISSELLSEGEEVMVDMRPHWIFFTGPALLTALALAIALLIEAQFSTHWSGLRWLLLVMMGVPAGWLALRVGRWLGMSLVVTNFRIIVRRGVFGRDLTQLRFQRVTEVHMNQTLVERLFGSGRLILDVQGGDADVTVDDIRQPRTLQRVLNHQLDRLAFPEAGEPRPAAAPAPLAGPGPHHESHGHTPPLGVPRSATVPPGPLPTPPPVAPAGTPAGSTVAEQLIALDDLRRRGIVTDEEFAAKKSELLHRL